MAALQAQRRIEIVATPVCGDCEIRMARLAELGDVEGDGWVDMTGRVALSDAAILVASSYADHQIRIFARDGEFRRVIGRRGEGPGEFRGVIDLRITPDGRTHVLDYGNRRISVLDSTLALERTIRVSGRPLGRGLLPLSDGSYVAALAPS